MTNIETNPSHIPDKDLVKTLNLGETTSKYKKSLIWSAIATSIIAILLLLAWRIDRDNSLSTQYKTAQIKRGNLLVTVSATGTLEPLNKVEVGSEISGTIKKVNVDYNDQVSKGQVLAVIDTEQLQAKVNQAQASLELSKAKVAEATATVVETKQKYKRLKALAARGLCAQDDCDAAHATYMRAQASLASTKAQVVQAQASLDAEKTNLRKATIYSPINGIVLKRNVEPGQTVAASLQTPVLFTLAEDLSKMELQVDVDEADIGKVNKNQDASFSVDAFPGKSFPAKITEVHLAPQTVEGVVTYKTVLSVDNSSLVLRPGMTATADIYVKQLKDVLLVPNAALRFTPTNINEASSSSSGSLISKIMPRPPRHAKKKSDTASASQKRQQTIWVMQDGRPSAVAVTIGASDGSYTEVKSGEVKIGMMVAIDTVNSSR